MNNKEVHKSLHREVLVQLDMVDYLKIHILYHQRPQLPKLTIHQNLITLEVLFRHIKKYLIKLQKLTKMIITETATRGVL